MLGLQRLARPANPDPGRVDEHVHATEPLRVLGDGSHAILFLAHVCGDRLCVQLGGGSLDLLARS